MASLSDTSGAVERCPFASQSCRETSVLKVIFRAPSKSACSSNPHTWQEKISPLGYLGKFYEQQGRWAQAKDLTEQALRLVQASDANDIAYRWQWQLGRIYKAQVEQARKQNKKETPDLEKAIAFYNAAFNTLQNLRRDLSASDPDLQFSFQEKTEDPVYRQLVDLLLLPQNPSPNLKQARQVIESLHVAALENFLQQPCASANPEALDQVVEEQAQKAAEKAAVIYPIILPNRLEVIFKLPGQDLQRYSYNPPTEEIRPAIQKLPLGKQLKKDPQAQYTFEDLVRITIKQLQLDLEEEYTFEAVKQESQQLYKWLIAPLRSRLEATSIKTLVFVLDGPLENIPMAALYDGKNYLIEKYAIAVSLGLQIPNPKPLPKGKLNVLAASLATPPEKLSQEFSKLDFVNKELDGIKQLGVAGTFLRDREFTSNAFNRKINESAFLVVHLATHGQFSVDPQDTFIINEDGKINVDQLDNMFRTVGLNRPDAVELLVFSACETASGDNRATLGIAGVTVKAGARSAIASLWTLDDESSSVLMKQFYQHLVKDNVSRAEALRLAQEALLKNPQYEHPRYWAPFILLGNWL